MLSDDNNQFETLGNERVYVGEGLGLNFLRSVRISASTYILMQVVLEYTHFFMIRILHELFKDPL